MYWNHRVWLCQNEHESWYEVRETYYNEAGEIAACTEGVSVARGESLEDLKQYIEWMLKAADTPTLVERGFKFVGWDEDDE